jgi:hypothetical protein
VAIEEREIDGPTRYANAEYAVARLLEIEHDAARRA